MSHVTREQAAFRSGKSPIIAKYLDEHKELMAGVAARGFLNLPGYAYDVGNRLEIGAKRGISELNLKILSETIERELKQTGIDYDLSYKNALMAWEIEKQSLMMAWDAELAGIKQGQAAAEETLEVMDIEVGKRAGVLMERKTELDLEAEGYRTTLAGLDGSTAAYEVQLANAKLITAQKKLELIPILQEIITKEQELLVAEQGKSAQYALLMAAEQEVINKKQTRLVPAVSELLNASEIYTNELAAQILLEKQIALENVAQSGIAIDIAEERTAATSIEIAIEDVQLDIQEKKIAIADLQDETEAVLLRANTDDVREITNVETASSRTVLTDERATDTYSLDKKRAAINVENDTREASSQRLSGSTISAANDITNIAVNQSKEETRVKAVAELTAKLTHLIS